MLFFAPITPSPTTPAEGIPPHPVLPAEYQPKADVFTFYLDPFARITPATANLYTRWKRTWGDQETARWPNPELARTEQFGVTFDQDAVLRRHHDILHPPADLVLPSTSPLTAPEVSLKVVRPDILTPEEKSGMFVESFTGTKAGSPPKKTTTPFFEVLEEKTVLVLEGKTKPRRINLASITKAAPLLKIIERLKQARHVTFAQVFFDGYTMLYFYVYNADKLVPFAEFRAIPTPIESKEGSGLDDSHDFYFALLDESGRTLDWLYLNSRMTRPRNELEYSSFQDTRRDKATR